MIIFIRYFSHYISFSPSDIILQMGRAGATGGVEIELVSPFTSLLLWLFEFTSGVESLALRVCIALDLGFQIVSD